VERADALGKSDMLDESSAFMDSMVDRSRHPERSRGKSVENQGAVDNSATRTGELGRLGV
jgi:hypothetical protein